MRRNGLFRQAAATPIVVALLWGAPAMASTAAGPVAMDIPAGPLAKALQIYAAETRLQLLYSSALVLGRTVPALRGRYTPDQALQRLLAGSPIDVEHTGPKVLVLKPRGEAGPHVEKTAHAVFSQASDPAPPVDPTNAPASASLPAGGLQETAVSAVVVTGTHIRGALAQPSPRVTLTKESMFKDGSATIGEALAKLPQAFNGVQNPVNSLNGSDRTGTNTGYSQGVNLRGLGASATLVLLNGRRLAGTGNQANFADVSALPSAAVDHVDILLDGASAIYGSDAIAGVVNIVTKKKYEGFDTTLRYGQDEGGVAGSLQFTQALGFGWTGGHFLATYEYQHANALASADRKVTADSDLRALGGTNHDAFNANPGNILGAGPTGGLVPIFAIPAGNGVGLKPSDFIAGGINYLNIRHNTDVTPDLDQSGFFADLTQDFGDRTHLDVEARYNLRHFQARQLPSQTVFSVTPKNPFYVSPNGAASETIGYSLDQVVGPQVQDSRSKSYDVSAGVDRDIGRTWRISGYVGYAGEASASYIQHLFNTGNLNEALGNTADNPLTSFSTAVNGFYNPYGSGAQNSQTLRDFVGGGSSTSANQSSTATGSLQADGVLFTLPAGPVRAAFGGQFRHERLESTTVSMVNGPVPTRSGGVNFHRDVSSAFGELNIPLVSPDMAVAGVRRLDLSVAGRLERYSDVGTTTNPKVGLTWRPIEDVAVHATYGTSFRAPSLAELSQPTLFAPVNQSASGVTTLILLQYGGNPGLKPETASTWTAGVDWTPKALPGLRLGATWFKINFTDEIGNPGVTFLSTALTNPALASLVTRLTPQTPATLAVIQAILAKATGTSATLFPASAYGAIVDARFLNTATMDVSGFDLNADYAWRWGANAFAVSAVGSYMDTFSQRQVSGGPLNSLLDTPNQPVNFRARTSLDWTRGPYVVRTTVNYTNSYKDPVAHRPVDAWTTLDLSLIWRAQQSRGPLEGVTASLFVRNLLSADPPFYDNPQTVAYDSANADPFGRVVSVELTKHW